MGERIEDPRQIDLEEAIAAKGGRPYIPPAPSPSVKKVKGSGVDMKSQDR